MGKLLLCGCGKHHVKVGNKSTVLWNGTIWDSRCAFERAWMKIEELERKLKENPPMIRLTKAIAIIPCEFCGQAVGMDYEVINNKIYHSGCVNDLGGEG